MNARLLFALVLAGLTPGVNAAAQNKEKVVLEYSDSLRVVSDDGDWIWHVIGNVDFKTESGHIYCDSAVFRPGESANLRGNVLLDDVSYQLKADSVFYDIAAGEAVARGKHVELWSYSDSMFASGIHAFYDRNDKSFEMQYRPVVYLKYPDTARMVEIIADVVKYDSVSRRAEAEGDVIITAGTMSAAAHCAIMNIDGDLLDLYEKPVVRREGSELTGEFITIEFENNMLSLIRVIDSAYGEFREPIDSAKTDFDNSILSGEYIKMLFDRGKLDKVLCFGQAYTWYYPSMRGGREYHENTVSGDSVWFDISQNRLLSVTVTGGAIGSYITGIVKGPGDIPDSLEHTPPSDSLQPVPRVSDSTRITDQDSGDALNEPAITNPDTTIAVDSLVLLTEDTTVFRHPPLKSTDSIDYRAERIVYSLVDSTISLRKNCQVTSAAMSLTAHEVELDTELRLVEAFAAEIESPEDSVITIKDKLADELQPAVIPVVLKDGNEELYGDYLEYSIDTEKGRIVQSKTDFEQGYYYGDRLLREQKHVFYIEDAYYTTCDADVPHFHFESKRMKLIEGNKAIVRPVVFYIGQVPLLAIPYYVFPLRRGRHSGFLTFRLGNIERGERYIENVGYYWAASEYWDWLAAIDYHELNRTFTFRNEINFRKRYVLDGLINIEHRRFTNYNSSVADENKRRDWLVQGRYSHQVSQSLKIDGFGSYQTSESYFTDYSNNIDEVLNREIISKLNFRKNFGSDVLLTGNFQHTVNLDTESRTDNIPTATLSLPTIYPFGSGSRDEEGNRAQKWYNGFALRYRPTVRNFSSRITIDSVFVVDTVAVVDSLGDTSFVQVKDTLSYRSRKKYARIDHNPSITLPAVRAGDYFTIVPRFSYSETWFKIFETDQSRAQGIDAGELYRTYSYNAGLSANTKLYGTVYPNVLGIVGLRHVFEPSLGWSWSPEIDRHPKVRGFAGGGASSRKSSLLNFGLGHLFQAKVRNNDKEKNLELLSLSSSFSYNFEADEKPLSDISTRFGTSSIPRLSINGSMTHTFYHPETGDEELFFPFLLNWNVNVRFSFVGKSFIFDEMADIPLSIDSTQSEASSSGKKGWNLSVNYSFSESGFYNFYRKRSQITLNVGFNLTPSTSVSFNQVYNVVDQKTMSTRVNIVRQLHCWRGSLWWVPTGPTKGFGFELKVIALPDIKLDNNYSSFTTSTLNRY